MANNLTAAQRLAFGGGSFDLASFPLVAELDSGFGVVTDVTKLVHDFGETETELFNLNPANPGSWRWPAVAWKLRNDDGFFSPGAAGSIWGSASPASFVMRLRVRDELTDPAVPADLFDETFAVVEVQLDEFEATVTGIHRLARWWAKRWVREDRLAVTWSTGGTISLRPA